MTPQSGYDSETAAWPCACGCVRMYVWVGMWVCVCVRTCSMRPGAHMHVRLCAQFDSGALWVCHTLETDNTNILTSSAQRKIRQRHFHSQEFNCDTDLRFDCTGVAGASRWLDSEGLLKSGMGQDGGHLSLNLHHFIDLWNTPTPDVIWIQCMSRRHWAVLVQCDLQTLNVYWESNGKLSSAPVMPPLYMTWQGLALPLGTLNRRYVIETNLKSPVEEEEQVREDQ